MDAEGIKIISRQLGFDLVGIALPTPSSFPDTYRQWIAEGQHGDMVYLANNIEERLDLRKKFPWVRSIISVALAYHTPAKDPFIGDLPVGKISRYAWGRDYHKVMEAKLKKLNDAIKATLVGTEDEATYQSRYYADTGPLLERELAANAGLGWIGKNTLLLHPRHGSFFFLGELLTSLAPPQLTPDFPMPDRCGTCTRCIDACPTDALTPYALNATKCISYHTLENRGDIPQEMQQGIAEGGFLVGCDICQDVCPFNRNPLETSEPDFAPRSPATLPLPIIQNWTERDWDEFTRGKATRRAKYPMWQRNAAILAQGDDDRRLPSTSS